MIKRINNGIAYRWREFVYKIKRANNRWARGEKVQ